MTSRTNIIVGVVAVVIIAGTISINIFSEGSQGNFPTSSTYTYNLSGQNPYDEKDRVPYSLVQFSLDFGTKTGKTISGWWSGAWHNANRINGCIKEEKPCFHATVNGNIALVKFDACYGEGNGEARITYDKTKDTLYWEVTKQPVGECYIPDRVTLEKDTK